MVQYLRMIYTSILPQADSTGGDSMPQRELRKDELFITDGEKLILLSMAEEKYLGWHTTDDGQIVDDIDSNQIEIAYREEDENGFGFGGGEYISRLDIHHMAEGIRKAVQNQEKEFSYSCQDDVFCLKLEYDPNTELFSFTASLVETLSWEYHITITKDNLSLEELDQYIQPFFEWEIMFPAG